MEKVGRAPTRQTEAVWVMAHVWKACPSPELTGHKILV